MQLIGTYVSTIIINVADNGFSSAHLAPRQDKTEYKSHINESGNTVSVVNGLMVLLQINIQNKK